MRPEDRPVRGRAARPAVHAAPLWGELRLPTPDLDGALRRALARLRPVPHAAERWADAIDELCLRPSKLLRPRLCALAYQGVSGAPAGVGVLDFAAGLELLHAFMLVHDDLIDQAALRRGGPSLHRQLGLQLGAAQRGRAEALAMLGGDALFAVACETMALADVPDGAARRALAAVLASARQAAMGETLDVLYETAPLRALSSASLAEVLRLKTASYTFVGPLLAGAILAGGSEERQRVLASFGERVGVAFQLADDLLDLLGCSNDTGKPTGGDLREGKRTVLMRLLLDRSPPRHRRRLEALLERGAHEGQRALTREQGEVVWVASLVRQTGVGAEMVSRVRNLVSAASRELGRADLEPSAAAALRLLSRKVVASVRQCAEGAAGPQAGCRPAR